jgi:tRNA(fMet)-specific endonuclease VapC
VQKIEALLVRLREFVPLRCMPALARAVDQLAAARRGMGRVSRSSRWVGGRLDIGQYTAGDTLLFTSTITVGELAYGASRSADEAGNLAAVQTLLAGLTVLPFDTAAAFLYGKLRAGLWQKGWPIGEPDLLIASVATAHGLILATHNRRHVDRIPGLQLTDWLA